MMDSDAEARDALHSGPPASRPGPSLPEFRGPLFYLGGAALLATVAIIAVAVAARHLGRTLTGSLELVQATILIASSSSLVAATLARRHATVHLLVDRVGPRVHTILTRISYALGALFFALLAAGGVWIASDLWNGHEESELLHIPYAPLRIISIAAVLGAAAIMAVQLRARRRR
jgi:TRAP-type C4-dicarboxylate transport system permease small subunit